MTWTIVSQINVSGYNYSDEERVTIMVTAKYGGEIQARIYWLGKDWNEYRYTGGGNLNDPPGTKFRARFSGTPSDATTDYITLPVTDVDTKSADIPRSWGSFSGTLYLERELPPNPPSTPSSISVPTTVKGGESITISWGSSSGATRYHLERSVNGGSWTQIYQGSNRSYTDTITKGWKTVAYRVRAYNSDGYSGYRTSPTITVINFPEMQIKINGVLKTSDAGWVRVNGQLREIDTIWVKINGAIKEVQ